MKIKALIPLATLALAACTSDMYVGTSLPDAPEPDVTEETDERVALYFDSYNANAASATRVAGAGAAALLNGEFRVFGTNNKGVVFNNYQVKWKGEANTSPTNRAGWEYIGYMSKGSVAALQQMKFWDLSAAQYDFIAFSGLADDQKINDINTNTFTVDASNMSSLFYANRVSAKPTHHEADPGVSPEYTQYGNIVKFTFRRATSRMRVGFYENIQGYAVKDLRFYYDDNKDAVSGTSTKTTVALEGTYPQSGEYTITYDINNVAHTTFSSEGTTTNIRPLGTIKYTKANSLSTTDSYLMADGSVSDTGEDAFIGATSATATYAVSTETIDSEIISDSPWHVILPHETNSNGLKLRVDYTLVALDGTGDQIHVIGAEAEVPKEYCQWQPNYSYTYIFKITMKSGQTAPDSPVGLYPITFDEEVSTAIEAFDEYKGELADPIP